MRIKHRGMYQHPNIWTPQFHYATHFYYVFFFIRKHFISSYLDNLLFITPVPFNPYIYTVEAIREIGSTLYHICTPTLENIFFVTAKNY